MILFILQIIRFLAPRSPRGALAASRAAAGTLRGLGTALPAAGLRLLLPAPSCAQHPAGMAGTWCSVPRGIPGDLSSPSVALGGPWGRRCRAPGAAAHAPRTQQALCRAGAGRAWLWGGGAGRWCAMARRGDSVVTAGTPCRALPTPAGCLAARRAPHQGQLLKELWGLAGPGELGTRPGATAPTPLPVQAVCWGGLSHGPQAAR